MTSRYSITLQLGDKTLKGSGDTALAALQSIPKPVKIFTKGVLTVSDGSKTNVQALTIARVKRLFYPLAQPILAKSLFVGLQ